MMIALLRHQQCSDTEYVSANTTSSTRQFDINTLSIVTGTLPISALCGNLVATVAASFHSLIKELSFGMGSLETRWGPDIVITASSSSFKAVPPTLIVSWNRRLQSSLARLRIPGPCHKDIMDILIRASLRAQYMDTSSSFHDDEVQGPSQRKMKLSFVFKLAIVNMPSAGDLRHFLAPHRSYPHVKEKAACYSLPLVWTVQREEWSISMYVRSF